MNDNHPDLVHNGQGEIDTGRPPQQSSDWELAQVPTPMIVQGNSKKFPQNYGFAKGAKEWIAETPAPNHLVKADVESVVDSKDPDKRLTQKAIAISNTDEVAARLQILKATFALVIQLSLSVQKDLRRVINKKDSTVRLKRHQTVRREMRSAEWFSMSRLGDGLSFLLMLVLAVVAVAAEVTVGWVNLKQVDLEGATGIVVCLLAYGPFFLFFLLLKYLDPGDYDRDRHAFTKRFNTLAMVMIPLAVWLFASKVSALLEQDFSQAGPPPGPAFWMVTFSIQLSYAITVYMATIKIGDAWFQFLGYDIHETPEWLDVCDAEATAISSLTSLKGIHGHVAGAIAVIESRPGQVLEQLKEIHAAVLRERAEAEREQKQRQQIIKTRGQAAALQAEADAAEEQAKAEAAKAKQKSAGSTDAPSIGGTTA